MPLRNDDNASDSSTEENLDEAVDQQLDNGQQGDAVGADSSDAQGDNAGQSTLDIVEDVVKAGDGQAAASPADGQDNGAAEQAGAETKEEDDEDYSDVPFHKHPRFQQLLRKSKAFEQDAGRYQNVQKFMGENGISDQETSDAFMFMAMVKRGDFANAWELIKPTVQQLLVHAGEVLTDELRQKVASGELTEEAAREIAKAQATAKSATASRSFDQQMQQRRQQQEAGEALPRAANDWVKAKQKVDPQFKAKEPLLRKEVALLIQDEGKPTTPDGVKAQLEKAYKLVVLPAARTGTQQGRPVPKVRDAGQQRRSTASGGASGTARPKPMTTLELIEQRLGT